MVTSGLATCAEFAEAMGEPEHGRGPRHRSDAVTARGIRPARRGRGDVVSDDIDQAYVDHWVGTLGLEKEWREVAGR